MSSRFLEMFQFTDRRREMIRAGRPSPHRDLAAQGIRAFERGRQNFDALFPGQKRGYMVRKIGGVVPSPMARKVGGFAHTAMARLDREKPAHQYTLNDLKLWRLRLHNRKMDLVRMMWQ